MSVYVDHDATPPSDGELEDPLSVADGLYTEAIEQLGGSWVIQATVDAAAHALGERASAACAGPVEVRLFEEEPGD